MRSLSILVMVICLAGCKDEPELEKSIFRPDAVYPELPAYSEWGYNTFGAFFDRLPFTWYDQAVPITVVHEGNATSFIFTGQKLISNSSYYRVSPVIMTIRVTGFNPATYEGLASLNDTTFDLASRDVSVEIEDGVAHTLEVLQGGFFIKRAQRLLVDDRLEEIILSGTFEFQAKFDSLPLTVSNGRFDLGINERNFFSY